MTKLLLLSYDISDEDHPFPATEMSRPKLSAFTKPLRLLDFGEKQTPFSYRSVHPLPKEMNGDYRAEDNCAASKRCEEC